MEGSRAALREAVNLLAADPSASEKFQSVVVVARLARMHPVRLSGALEPLNPLVDLHRADPEAFGRVVALIDSKRGAAGLDLLNPPSDGRFDKTEYMRQFMDAKRQRQRRAAEIENDRRPARDRLVGRARLEFMDAQAAKWKADLDARIERAREAAGGRLPRETFDAIRAQFWSGVDKQLDELAAQGMRP